MCLWSILSQGWNQWKDTQATHTALLWADTYLHGKMNGLHIMADTYAALMDETFNLTDVLSQACIIPQQTQYWDNWSALPAVF